jgi:hypothetical protein
MIGGVSSTISGSSGWSTIHCQRRGVTYRIAASSAANTSQITTFRPAPIHHAADPDSLRVSTIDGITSNAATKTGSSNRFCIRVVRSSTVATFDRRSGGRLLATADCVNPAQLRRFAPVHAVLGVEATCRGFRSGGTNT